MVSKAEPGHYPTQNLSHDQHAASLRTYRKSADDVLVHLDHSQSFHGANKAQSSLVVLDLQTGFW
jgi:hypothetical protein